MVSPSEQYYNKRDEGVNSETLLQLKKNLLFLKKAFRSLIIKNKVAKNEA